MKRKLLFLCMGIFAMSANAQLLKLGVVAGTNLNWQCGRDGSSDGARFGLRAGVTAELGLRKKDDWYASSGLLLSQKNHLAWPWGNYHNKEYINYIEVSVHIGYKFNCGKNWKLMLEVGPYFSYGAWGKVDVCNVEDDSLYRSYSNIFEAENLRRWDVGVSGNFSVRAFEHYQLTLGYYHNISNIARGTTSPLSGYYHPKVYNRTFSATLGYLF